MRRAGLVLLALALPAAAHETNFGLSPHTVYRDGWLVEGARHLESRSSRAMRRRSVEDEVHALYGIRADLSAGLRASWMREEADGEGAEGPGDLALLGKYRLFRFDGLLTSDYLSALGELTLPTAPRTRSPELSEGGVSALAGLGYARVRKFWSGFLDAGMRVHESKAGHRPGNELLANAAVGWRPRVAEIDEWDAQALLELNFERVSGDHEAWFLSPGISTGRGTTMFKAAVQLPVRQDWEGRRPEVDYRLKLVVEHLF